MIRVAAGSHCTLGEGALWHPHIRELFWLDLHEPALYRMRPGEDHRRLALPAATAPLGTIAMTGDPGLMVLANRTGLSLLDINAGSLTPLADPEAGRFEIGYNDGKVDRWGRLWFGTSDLPEAAPRGALWCLPPGGRPVLADAGFAVSNGPAFSPDGTTLYFCDSGARKIWAYSISKETPRPSGRRVFVDMAVDEGYPDGATVDAEGCLWVAHWDGWRVTRFSPQGERILVVPMPVPRVTSVAFGGDSLHTLFVTSARTDLSPALLAAAPHSGDVFALEPGVAGLAETAFTITGTSA